MIFGDWWVELSSASKIYWSISIIFSILFFIQFVMSLFGLDFLGEDADTPEDESGYSLDGDFALFSVRSIIAFFTFFGWTGVMLLNGGSGVLAATFFAFLSGFAAMALVAYLFYLFHKLTRAENTDIYQALFSVAEVYLSIPEHRKGMGKVHIRLGGGFREMDAVTEGENIQTGKKVKVVEILDANVLVVVPLETYEISNEDMQ